MFKSNSFSAFSFLRQNGTSHWAQTVSPSDRQSSQHFTNARRISAPRQSVKYNVFKLSSLEADPFLHSYHFIDEHVSPDECSLSRREALRLWQLLQRFRHFERRLLRRVFDGLLKLDRLLHLLLHDPSPIETDWTNLPANGRSKLRALERDFLQRKR